MTLVELMVGYRVYHGTASGSYGPAGKLYGCRELESGDSGKIQVWDIGTL